MALVRGYFYAKRLACPNIVHIIITLMLLLLRGMKMSHNTNYTIMSKFNGSRKCCKPCPPGPCPPVTSVLTGVGAPGCETGESGDMYIDLSTGHMYYKLTAPVPPAVRPIPSPSGNTLLVGSGQTYTNIEDALAAANDGDRILLDAETFTINSTINVNKSVTIEGQGKGATKVITTSNTVISMFNVTVSNVVFKDMSLIQNFVSTATVETVIYVNNTSATGIYVHNCEISVCEFGISLRAAEFQITNCDFIYSPDAGIPNNYRYIYILNTSGQSIINNNTFVSTAGPTSCSFIIITNIGAGTLQGTLVISNNSQLSSPDPLRHLLVMEEYSGSDFKLYIINNTTLSESNAPVLLYNANLNLFTFISVEGNSVQNTAGKGLIAIDFNSTGTTEIFSSNNTLANESFAPDWESATNPLSFIVGYRTSISPAPELPLEDCYWLPLL